MGKMERRSLMANSRPLISVEDLKNLAAASCSDYNLEAMGA
jgi:hypothetical protein